MSLSKKILILLIFLILSFAFGRYSVKSVDTKTTEIKQENKDVRTVTHTTVIEQPNGVKKTIIISNTEDRSKSFTDTKVLANTNKRSMLNISLIAGTMLGPEAARNMDYGLSINKEMFGPVTLGAYGMKSGAFGLSIGVNF